MDFEFSEEQESLRELAREILENEISTELLKELESSGDWFARNAWARLAEANLLGLAVPEEHGGMGMGLLELCLLLREIGRVAAPLPALPTLLLGGLPIARFGTRAQQAEWLPGVAAGSARLTAALVDADSGDPVAPAARARREGDGFVLDGRKRAVPLAGAVQRVLVPASLESGVGVFLVDPRSDGVALTTAGVTSTGESHFDLDLDGVTVGVDALLGGDEDAAATLQWLSDCALVGIAALQLGVSERALEITSKYVSEREQFGGPIGAFQAVQHRAADCYIDLAAMRWTTWRAAWRLSAGEPAMRDAAVAKFWAAEGGARIANSAQHLHGGMGVDRDYPLHRYFLWTKSLELMHGGATPQLVRLGRDLARTGPQETA